jgi:hypothetical protein
MPCRFKEIKLRGVERAGRDANISAAFFSMIRAFQGFVCLSEQAELSSLALCKSHSGRRVDAYVKYCWQHNRSRSEPEFVIPKQPDRPFLRVHITQIRTTVFRTCFSSFVSVSIFGGQLGSWDDQTS